MSDILNTNARPTQEKDMELANKVYSEQINDERQKAIDDLFQTEMQPAAEDYSRIEKLGFVPRKTMEGFAQKVMEKLEAKDKQIDQLLTLLKKKAAQGDNPLAGKGIIGPEPTEEEQRYAELEKIYPGVGAYMRKPTPRR